MSRATCEIFADTEMRAAANNAGWCDAMLRSHNGETWTAPHLWFTDGDAPLYYPHAVTLGGSGHAQQQYADIAQLLQAATRAGRSISIKDSFACLDLAPLSCEILFTADWLHLSIPVAGIEKVELGATWRPVQTAAELMLWEQAWRGSPQISGIFVPRLLADPDVTVLTGYQNGQIVTGCTLYRSKDTVGYTNLFGPQNEAESWRLACIAEIARRHPDCQIVGYESGADSTAMQNIGFRKIGDLQVWRSAG